MNLGKARANLENILQFKVLIGIAGRRLRAGPGKCCIFSSTVMIFSSGGGAAYSCSLRSSEAMSMPSARAACRFDGAAFSAASISRFS